MKNKVVLITGGSTGIGKATAIALAKLGATILFASRNKERGEQALQEIRQQSNNEQVYFFCYDLSLIASIRQLAQEIESKYNKIDVLINNAGILPGKHTLTPEGLEVSWATNYLSGFLLTSLLLPLIMNSEAGRIINVSSEAHRLGQLHLEKTSSPKEYSSFTAYCDSKLANILFTYELSRRLELTPITVNCLHPGVIASNFGTTGFGLLKWLFKAGRPFMKSAKQGASTVVYLAASTDVEHVTGKYFKNRKVVSSAKITYNTHLARQLWNFSEEQTDLAPA